MSRSAVELEFLSRVLGKLKHNEDIAKILGEEGQKPETLVITCIDSRSLPIIFGALEPGKALGHTNVAATIPPCEKHPKGFHGTSAVIEIGNVMAVKEIFIIGHGDCGGIKKMIEYNTAKPSISRKVWRNVKSFVSSKGPSFLKKWMKIHGEDKEMQNIIARTDLSSGDKQRQCEERGVIVSLGNIMKFPEVEKRVKDGELRIHGLHLDLKTATLSEYNVKEKKFKRLNLLDIKKEPSKEAQLAEFKREFYTKRELARADNNNKQLRSFSF